MKAAKFRILVTGAAGFVGRHLVPAMARRGFAVAVTCRDEASLPVAWRGDRTIRIAGIADLVEADLDALMGDIDVVVHLAGLAAAPAGDDAEARQRLHEANVVATQRVVEAAARRGVMRFINLSSVRTVVGNSSMDVVDDHFAADPPDAYGLSKREAERHIVAFARSGRFAISLRPPLVVGPDAGGNWRSLQKLAASGWPLPFASLRARRSFVAIGTLVDAIIHLCSRDWAAETSGAYLLADPEPLSLPEVASALRAGMNLPPRLFGCPPAVFATLGALTGRQRQIAGLTGPLQLDSTRFFGTFDFAPQVPLRQAIRLSGQGYMQMRRTGRAGE